jgi:hypothetical protein
VDQLRFLLLSLGSVMAMPGRTSTELKFRNPAGFRKTWGTAEPECLRKVFEHLHGKGFSGPASWADPYQLLFERQIDGDLAVKAVIGRVGEFPPGVFNFDTTILLYSQIVAVTEKRLNLWQQDAEIVSPPRLPPSVAVLSVTLSHLKWNHVQGRNPTWYVSNAVDATPGRDWSSDWDEFGEPFVCSLADTKCVVDCLVRSDFIPRASWVKSDGVRSAARTEYAAILMFHDGRSDEAVELLRKRLTELQDKSDRASELARHRCMTLLEEGPSLSLP